MTFWFVEQLNRENNIYCPYSPFSMQLPSVLCDFGVLAQWFQQAENKLKNKSCNRQFLGGRRLETISKDIFEIEGLKNRYVVDFVKHSSKS